MNRKRLFILSLLLCACLLTACVPISIPTFGTLDSTKAEATPEEIDAPSKTKPTETKVPETEPPAPKKRIAITFDDGPSRQGLTERLVDEFAKYGGKATFFVLGNLISEATGEALAHAHANGCEIGIHGYTHEIYFDTCSDEDFTNELALTKQAIEQYIDAKVTLLRPPGGRLPSGRALSSGYPVIMWSVDSEDWRYKGRGSEEQIHANIHQIVDNVMENVQDGDIVLMHEIYTNSYEATCILLKTLHEMGFEFVTVSELIGGEHLTAGKYIYSETNIK